MTIADLLIPGADDDPALVVPGGASLSYARLRDLTSETARRFEALGMTKGDRVAVVLPNGPEAIVTFLAVCAMATACPMNPGYKENEFRFYFDDTRARFLVVPPGDGAEARRAFGDRGPVIEVALDRDGNVSLRSSYSREQGANKVLEDDDIALVLHTSGTTSRPKRVPLRHRHVAASVDNIVRYYRLSRDDATVNVMPLFHVHGLVGCVLATFASGGTVVLPSDLTPLAFWPAARAVRPTWFSASPTLHQLILMRATTDRPAGSERLRFVRSSSSALSAVLMERMEARFAAPVLEAYGMTEASYQIASNPLPPGKRIPGSVGPGAGVEIAILDESGRRQGPGSSGEVAIKGPNVVDGYEDSPEVNAAAFTDGWFRTGDLGTISEDGYLTLSGRIKELINRGGEKIPPGEVDEVLASHPAVQEAVCFGMAHETWGEEVGAAVVLRNAATADELLRYCRGRLADFKVPRRLFIVDSIPRTPTGKVQRRFLAEQLSATPRSIKARAGG